MEDVLGYREKYKIGFTENEYSHIKDSCKSPDHQLGYNSAALDYAARHNKGTENIFNDHSDFLDKQRSKSVSKIHGNILGLVFELTERRKSTTLGRASRSPRGDFQRPFSRQSEESLDSIKTSSSLPIIQVQQLPPLSQYASFPDLNRSFTAMPDLSLNSSRDSRYSRKDKKTKHNLKFNMEQDNGEYKHPDNQRNQNKEEITENERKKETSEENIHRNQNTSAKKHNKTDTNKEPKLFELVKLMVKMTKEQNSNQSVDGQNQLQQQSNSPRVPLTISEKDINTVVPKTAPTSKAEPSAQTGNKWTRITNRLIQAHRSIKDESEESTRYKGRYSTPKTSKMKLDMSFCQSSYGERSEKVRINNIRRRHQSQKNTGPLDFNKLRRQITARSETMFW